MNKKKTFNQLLIAQSLTAFGDNAVYSVIMGTLLLLVNSGQKTLLQFGLASALYANCLFLPYVLLSPILGWFSDYFPKKKILITANLIKAAGCFLGLIGIYTGNGFMMISYLIIGMGAAIYSPAKYGIIPELKEREELVKANAAVEMTTIFSILLGIIGGGLLVDSVGSKGSYLILTLAYLLATLFNMRMEESGIAHKQESSLTAIKEFGNTLRGTFAKRRLRVALLGTTIFWFSASFVKLNLQTWGQVVVRLTTATSLGLLALWLSIGIILGSFIAGKIFSTGQIQQSWLFGLSMGGVIIGMVMRYFNYPLLTAELMALGTLGGLFLIPLNTEIQHQADHRHIGKVIAIGNFLENSSMLFSAALFWFLNKNSFSSVTTFLVIGGFLCLINVVWFKSSLKRA